MTTCPPDRRFRRWRGWILRTDDHVRRQIDDEIQSHLDARTDHLIGMGSGPDAARAEAERRFGDLEAARASLYAQALARRRRLTLGERVGDVGRDLRYVLRTLVRAPAFTVGVVATLTLGLGINASVFRVADQALFRPPAGVHDPYAIRRVETSASAIPGAAPGRVATFSYPEARRIDESGAFAATALQALPRTGRAPDGTDVSSSAVDDRFFRLLGVSAVAGRTFDELEGRPGAGIPVAVISFDYWTRHLGSAAPDGRASVRVGDKSYRLIGVLPPGFSGLDLDPVDVWLPLGVAELGSGTMNGVVIRWYQTEMLHALRVLGRPRDGISDTALDQRLTALFEHADGATGLPPRTAMVASIVPAGDSGRTQDSNFVLRRLTAVAAFVLLIACANAVNLLLARSLRRTREIAVRLAVGASRARLFRLLLLESLTLAIAGGGAAALCGHWAGDALRRLVFPDDHWSSPLLDPRSLAFTGALAVISGFAAGVVPAIQATRPDLLSALKEGRGRGSAGLRTTRAVLVVVQTALSLVLLVSAGLLVLSLVRLNAVGLGFDPDGLVVASVGVTRAAASVKADQVAASIPPDGTPREIALSSVAPFGATATRTVMVPGSTYEPESFKEPLYMAVSPNFFTVLGTRLVRGRLFNAADARGSAPVAIVNESMARRYWGPLIPAGGCILVPPAPCAEVVGVVQDVREAPTGVAAPLRFYLPLEQQDWPAGTLVVRTTSGNVSKVAAVLRAAIPAAQRGIVEVTADRVRRATRPWRTATVLFLALGAIALALACVGVYSVMNYLVSERLHEIGVRIALGATRGNLVQLVLGSGLRLSLVGGGLGLLCTAATGRVLKTLLFDVSPFNPAIYTLGLVCLTLATVTATFPAALRASRLDAVAALRSE